MAVWRIHTDDARGRVVLSRAEVPQGEGEEHGRGDPVLRAELEGWAVQMAEPWDLVESRGTAYFRQASARLAS